MLSHRPLLSRVRVTIVTRKNCCVRGCVRTPDNLEIGRPPSRPFLSSPFSLWAQEQLFSWMDGRPGERPVLWFFFFVVAIYICSSVYQASSRKDDCFSHWFLQPPGKTEFRRMVFVVTKVLIFVCSPDYPFPYVPRSGTENYVSNQPTTQSALASSPLAPLRPRSVTSPPKSSNVSPRFFQ